MNWFARNAREGEALRAILLGNWVSGAIGFILALLGQLSGGETVLGWSTVVLFLVFTLGWAYFLIVKPSGA